MPTAHQDRCPATARQTTTAPMPTRSAIGSSICPTRLTWCRRRARNPSIQSVDAHRASSTTDSGPTEADRTSSQQTGARSTSRSRVTALGTVTHPGRPPVTGAGASDVGGRGRSGAFMAPSHTRGLTTVNPAAPGESSGRVRPPGSPARSAAAIARSPAPTARSVRSWWPTARWHG
ncbi:hypothetical protein SDC9_156220 [bioreactor metagenome]|uniref:Uncharacterized protein n=1 Tax=bioreactor metagenome TaxID=1076179 RepID=A0A645F5X9_9ZZZZ